MVLDKFIREAAGRFIWLLNMVFVWFRQRRRRHAAACSNSVLLARAAGNGAARDSCGGSSALPLGASSAAGPHVAALLRADGAAEWQPAAAGKCASTFWFYPISIRERMPCVLSSLKTKRQTDKTRRKLENKWEFQQEASTFFIVLHCGMLAFAWLASLSAACFMYFRPFLF